MIHLDTNILIYLADRDAEILAWCKREVNEGQEFGVSAIAWYEFLSGPVSEDKVSLIESILSSVPVPFDGFHAEMSARFFNETGRVRKRKVDTMIASTAILQGGKLATRNVADFTAFRSLGLEVIEV
jgi:predicted nucleic acid-binding protein